MNADTFYRELQADPHGVDLHPSDATPALLSALRRRAKRDGCRIRLWRFSDAMVLTLMAAIIRRTVQR